MYCTETFYLYWKSFLLFRFSKLWEFQISWLGCSFLFSLSRGFSQQCCNPKMKCIIVLYNVIRCVISPLFFMMYLAQIFSFCSLVWYPFWLVGSDIISTTIGSNLTLIEYYFALCVYLFFLSMSISFRVWVFRLLVGLCVLFECSCHPVDFAISLCLNLCLGVAVSNGDLLSFMSESLIVYWLLCWTWLYHHIGW